VEGTNLSEGRGTTRPFEFVGAPFIDGYKLAKTYNLLGIPGIIARPVSFVPVLQKFAGERCEGVHLHVSDRTCFPSLKAALLLLETVAELYPNDFAFPCHTNGKYFFDLLAGTKHLREKVLAGRSREFLQECGEQTERFQKQAKPYLLYS
jgi:uncharacterized protein YbbC (DUF1343 family)